MSHGHLSSWFCRAPAEISFSLGSRWKNLLGLGLYSNLALAGTYTIKINVKSAKSSFRNKIIFHAV